MFFKVGPSILLLSQLFHPVFSVASVEEDVSSSPLLSLRQRSQSHSGCDNNAVLAAWCDSARTPELDCRVSSALDEYECSCSGEPSLCPTDCVESSDLLSQTHYGIRCQKIPADSPNYILKEWHSLSSSSASSPKSSCENNAAVSSWCDDHVNKHLNCGLYPAEDQYVCRCSGKHSNCPDECIGSGTGQREPIVKTANSVLCSGIPADSPNYILKQD